MHWVDSKHYDSQMDIINQLHEDQEQNAAVHHRLFGISLPQFLSLLSSDAPE